MRSRIKPVYFPSGGETLFGWLHPPLGDSLTEVGVIVCNPFGYETVCAHRSLRAIAQTCAEVGMPTLRFDYSGTGDSSGSSTGTNQIAAWLADLEAAIDALQQMTGAKRVCLVGMRLGALLAGVVASRRQIEYLIAVAPVTSGRRYVRELRAFQAGAAGDSAQTRSDRQDSATAGCLDVTGFELSQTAVDELTTIDLTKLKPIATTAALILDREDLPGAQAWAAALRSADVATQYAALSGFNDMITAPHAAIVPGDIIQALKRWLGANRGAPGDSASTSISNRLPKGARMRLVGDSGVALTERAMFIDANHSLFAIVTEPTHRSIGTQTSGHAIVLLNTGATHRMGPNRMYVDWARLWAARGYVVLRLDLAGLGDSETAPGQEANQVYPPGAVYDISIAIEFLRRRRGVRDVTLAGVCAGAYHALHSARAGLPVKKLLMINPLTFYWKQGSQLSDLQIAEVVRNPGVYSKNARSIEKWHKLLRGQVNLVRVARVFVRRLWMAIDSLVRDLCRRTGIQMPNDLGWELQEVAGRGVRMVFLFARFDGGHELLRIQGGSIPQRLGDRCRVHVIDNADHIFTQRHARAQLLGLLNDELTLY